MSKFDQFFEKVDSFLDNLRLFLFIAVMFGLGGYIAIQSGLEIVTLIAAQPHEVSIEELERDRGDYHQVVVSGRFDFHRILVSKTFRNEIEKIASRIYYYPFVDVSSNSGIYVYSSIEPKDFSLIYGADENIISGIWEKIPGDEKQQLFLLNLMKESNFINQQSTDVTPKTHLTHLTETMRLRILESPEEKTAVYKNKIVAFGLAFFMISLGVYVVFNFIQDRKQQKR